MSDQKKSDSAVNILSIDDKKSNLYAIERLLQEPGLHIVSRCSGQEALEYLYCHSVAVILLDINMPVMDGFETAKLIRKNESTKDTPIIFITATVSPREDQIAKAYALGAVDFILKEFLQKSLKTKVSVFTELYRHTQALEQQKEAKEEEAKQLRTALESLQLLTGWQDGAITAQLAGVGPLRQHSPEAFTEIQTEYELLLDAYLESVGFGQTPPRERINSLANRMGLLSGGPRDVIDVHLRSVTHKCKNVHPMRENAYAMEGRLLALELMGFLVDYYRRPRAVH